tara:strand:+ start:48 stop:191 length:144 start_codon:yes stop_codon:yes gene_type:complete
LSQFWGLDAGVVVAGVDGEFLRFDFMIFVVFDGESTVRPSVIFVVVF